MDKQTHVTGHNLGTFAEDARALLSATADVAGEKVIEARQRLAAALERGQELYGRVSQHQRAMAVRLHLPARNHRRYLVLLLPFMVSAIQFTDWPGWWGGDIGSQITHGFSCILFALVTALYWREWPLGRKLCILAAMVTLNECFSIFWFAFPDFAISVADPSRLSALAVLYAFALTMGALILTPLHFALRTVRTNGAT